MIPLVIPGRAMAATAPIDTRARLGAFGEDLIAVAAVHLSPERLPGVVAVGDAIGPIGTLTARRNTWGRFARVDGKGATLANVDGRLAALTTTGVPWTDARPTDPTSFGFGMLYNFTPDALASSRDHMGNNESTGNAVPAILSRAVGSASDQMLRWKGITNTWITAQPADAQARLRITSPGWYIIAADEAGGKSALAIDRRDPIIAPTDALVPTLNAIRFGGSSDATPGLGAVAAFLVCDGPLVQDPTRLEAWHRFCQAVLDDIRA